MICFYLKGNLIESGSYFYPPGASAPPLCVPPRSTSSITAITRRCFALLEPRNKNIYIHINIHIYKHLNLGVCSPTDSSGRVFKLIKQRWFVEIEHFKEGEGCLECVCVSVCECVCEREMSV